MVKMHELDEYFNCIYCHNNFIYDKHWKELVCIVRDY